MARLPKSGMMVFGAIVKKPQDPKEKRNIRADERLLAVFAGKKIVSMFEMTKLVNGHLV